MSDDVGPKITRDIPNVSAVTSTLRHTDLDRIERDSVVNLAREYHARYDGSLYGLSKDELFDRHARLHHLLGRVLDVVDTERRISAKEVRVYDAVKDVLTPEPPQMRHLHAVD